MEKQREQWGSRIGFILAAAGSAVGLGNIWKFPYTVGANGGGAFIIIYLCFTIFIGFTVMLGEFTLGRKTSLASAGALKSVGRHFSFIGFMGVLSAFLIMGFYPVVGGWAVAYIVKSFSGLTSNPDAIGDLFDAFITNGAEPIIWTAVFLAMNVVIVIKGVAKGIEAAGKVLMPLLFIIMIVISVYGLTIPGAWAGMEFLFVPDFSKVTGATFLSALGQAFFSLSLGMGIMITYGSYLSKDENLPGNAAIVASLDTLVAILAGIAMFPAMFAYGIEPAVGPGLVFVVVPLIFSNFGSIMGPLFAALFFIALTVAALTSSVSLLEVVVAYLMDEHKATRPKAVAIAASGMIFLSIFASLSLGVMADVKFLGAGVFDVLDLLTDKVFLAIGGAFVCLVIGFFMDKSEVRAEIESHGKKFALFEVWYFLIKYIAPIAITVVAVAGIMSVEQSALMIFGVAFIFALLIFALWGSITDVYRRLNEMEKNK